VNFMSSACGIKVEINRHITMASICFDINTQYAIVPLRSRLSPNTAPYFLHDGAQDRSFVQKFNRNTVAALRSRRLEFPDSTAFGLNADRGGAPMSNILIHKPHAGSTTEFARIFPTAQFHPKVSGIAYRACALTLQARAL